MPNSWITHLPHFLDEKGNIPKELPLPILQMMNAICSFVVYATNFVGEMDETFPACFVVLSQEVNINAKILLNISKGLSK